MSNLHCDMSMSHPSAGVPAGGCCARQGSGSSYTLHCHHLSLPLNGNHTEHRIFMLTIPPPPPTASSDFVISVAVMCLPGPGIPSQKRIWSWSTPLPMSFQMRWSCHTIPGCTPWESEWSSSRTATERDCGCCIFRGCLHRDQECVNQA